MKKITILMTSLFLMGGFVYSNERISTSEEAVKLVTVNDHEKPIKFIEQGVEFLIYPYGDFDYKKFAAHHDNGTAVKVGINIPGTGIHVGSSKKFGGDDYIKYDNAGKIVKIGHNYIGYDYSGRISKAGNVYIDYNKKGLVSTIGGLHIYYDYSGNIASLDGYVHPYDYKKGYGHNFYYKKDIHHSGVHVKKGIHAKKGLHVQKGFHGKKGHSSVKVHKKKGGFKGQLSFGHHGGIKKKHHGGGHKSKIIVKKRF